MQTDLDRSLHLSHATSLVVGTIVGASVFVQASEMTRHLPNIKAVIAAWIASGVLTLFGALACAELASAFPRTGGVYVFLRDTYSPLLGFLWGWAMFWTMHSGIIAAGAVVFARHAAVFVPLEDRGIRAVAVGMIALISAINYTGVRFGSRLQTAFTAGKLLAVVLIVTLGMTVGAQAPSHFQYGAAVGPKPVAVDDFLLALVAGLFAFGGWHVVTYTAGETIDPRRTIPRALALGILIVTSVYVALNTVYFYVLPLDRVMASTRVAADAATALLGDRAGGAIAALVMASVFGALCGSMLAAPRVYFAMARDGLLFHWIDDVHPRFRTPHRAIVLQGIWASLLVWTGTYRQLFTRVIFTEWIFFALMAGGIFLLRRRPDYQPAYRVWGFPWTVLVFVCASAAIVVNRLIAEPLDSAIGLALVGIGVPVYFMAGRRHTRLAGPEAAA
jgi:APA family basic amino acid/polyamine antiporter